ncbi:hypothetical protein Y032_0082g1548 [Ancylostoma ceylanicum]|uniref:Uncharacterized protein n=1 Tax=Ancylostoma ceylanicum TaxID=53326 RepID=A0A016TSJ6_9BILA|nr:hypothetical protein Y032_0082g1548 [Ancylostoma ceylanicum]
MTDVSLQMSCSYILQSFQKILPPASTARLLSRAAPPMHYHTCCDVAQSTRSVAGGKYFLERLYVVFDTDYWHKPKSTGPSYPESVNISESRTW